MISAHGKMASCLGMRLASVTTNATHALAQSQESALRESRDESTLTTQKFSVDCGMCSIFCNAVIVPSNCIMPHSTPGPHSSPPGFASTLAVFSAHMANSRTHGSHCSSLTALHIPTACARPPSIPSTLFIKQAHASAVFRSLWVETS